VACGPVVQIVGNTLTGGTWEVFAGSTITIGGAGNLTVNQGNVGRNYSRGILNSWARCDARAWGSWPGRTF
jgi:hypothetical protein